MATQSLGLPTDPRTSIFRKIVALLRTDALLSRVVGKNWFVWDGDSNSAQAFASSEGVAVRLEPKLGPMQWLDETEQICPLSVVLDYAIPGFDADDPLNFQGAVERALFPVGQVQATTNALNALGAETGLISFDQPSLVQNDTNDAGLWEGRIIFSLNVRRTLNP